MQGGANQGLRAYGIAQVLKCPGAGGKGHPAALLRRLWRPEDISRDAAYKASFSEVYSSEEQQLVELDAIVGKCSVLPAGSPLPGAHRALARIFAFPPRARFKTRRPRRGLEKRVDSWTPSTQI